MSCRVTTFKKMASMERMDRFKVPEEARDVEAILASDLDSAPYVSGSKADLVVLAKDLYQLDANDISEVDVVRTVMGGRVVYNANPPQ